MGILTAARRVFVLAMLAPVFLAGCDAYEPFQFQGTVTITYTGTPSTITLALADVSAGYVRLAVSSTFNAYGATVYRNGFVCGHVDLSTAAPVDFVDTNFSGGGQYSYRVEGTFLFSGRVASNLLTVDVPGPGGGSTGGGTVPAPAQLRATALDNSVRLDWEAVPGASSYNVYAGTAPGVTPSSGTGLPATASPRTIDGLTDGTTYYFVVTALGGSGPTESAPSQEVSATPHPPPVVATVPAEVVLGGLDAPVGLPSDGASAWLYEIYVGALSRVDLTTGTRSQLASVAPGGNGGAIAMDNAHVYFSTWGAVYRVGKDGSGLVELARATDTNFILPTAAGVLVRHGQSRISLVGPGGALTDLYVRPSLSSGFGGGMAADSGFLYWADSYQGTIRRMALSGGPVGNIVSGASHPGDLLLDAGTLYFSTDEGIRTIPAAGGAVVLLAPVNGFLAKAGPLLFVAGDSALSRVDLRDGSVTVLVQGTQSYARPAVTDNGVFWLESGSRYANRYGSLMRIPR